MLTWALKQYFCWHARRVRESMEHPRNAQLAAFQRLRRLLRGSQVAAQSGFDRCESLEDCRGLPASDSESLRALFAQVFEEGARAKRLFGRSGLFGFARTSG